jgi:Na+/proline symporter
VSKKKLRTITIVLAVLAVVLWGYIFLGMPHLTDFLPMKETPHYFGVQAFIQLK